MHIITHQTFFGNILGIFVVLRRQFHGKQRIQPLDKAFVSSHKSLQAIHILRYIKRVIPGITFDKPLAMSIQHIEFFLHLSGSILRPDKTQTLVHQMFIGSGPLQVSIGHFPVAHFLRHMIDRPIVITILQGDRCRTTALFHRHIPQFHILFQSFEVWNGRSTHDSFQGQFFIHRNTFHVSIGYDRSPMISDHTPVFIGHMRPDRKQTMYTLPIMSQKRCHDIFTTWRIEQIEQRVQSPIGVPNRKYRIIRELIRLMDLLIQSPVRTVIIHIHRWIDHGVIHGRINITNLIIIPLYIDHTQRIFPFLSGLRTQLPEIFTRSLDPQIIQCTAGTHRWKCNFHLQRRSVRQVEIKISHDIPSSDFGKIAVDIEFPPHSVIQHRFHLFISVTPDRFWESNRKIGVVHPGPTICNPVTGQQSIVFYPQIGPKHFSVVIINTMFQIEEDMSVSFRESISMYPYPFGGCQFCLHPIILEHHGIITRPGFFCGMWKTGTISAIGVFSRSRVKFNISGYRHNQDIA